MENKNEDTVFKEHEDKLFASVEDVKNIMEMYTHFEIPLSERLDKALKDFNAVQSIENQRRLRYEACYDICHSTHEVLCDDMFKEMREDCAKIVYEMSFDTDLQEALSNNK